MIKHKMVVTSHIECTELVGLITLGITPAGGGSAPGKGA